MSRSDPIRLIPRSFRKKAVIPAGLLANHRIHPQQLRRMVESGRITRVGRGRYSLPTSLISENYDLTLVATAAPRAVVCLISALRFHDIGTQIPAQVWIAVERGDTRPRIDDPPVRIATITGPSFRFDCERHVLDGVPVLIYSAAKTVADCFKFRNKVGVDVAIEALCDGLRSRRFTRSELWAAAKVCRVTAIIRPYLEVL